MPCISLSNYLSWFALKIKKQAFQGNLMAYSKFKIENEVTRMKS